MSLCVGFDETDYQASIIDNFEDVDYIKINLAFNTETKIKEIQKKAQENNIKVILDCKIGDIKETQKAYLEKYNSFFALTINPFMGADVIEPFIGHHLNCFVLLLTSNKSREDFELNIFDSLLEKLLFYIENNNNIGIVLGATIPDKYFEIVFNSFYKKLKILPKTLIPGIGRQKGNVKSILDIAKKITNNDRKEIKKLIFSNSSQIMKSNNPLLEIKKMKNQLTY